MRRGRNCNCGCRRPAAISTLGIKRGMQFHSVLDSEFGTDNYDWFDASFAGGSVSAPFRGATPDVLKYCWMDTSRTPSYNTGSPNFDSRWILTMKPVRFQLGLHWDSKNRNAAVLHILESDPHEFGFKSAAPPDSSHVMPMQLKSITMTFPPYGINGIITSPSKVYKYRVLINSVDVTGVRDVNYELGANPDTSGHAFSSASISLLSENIILTGSETIWIDCWVQYTVQDDNFAAGTLYDDGSTEWIYVGGLAETGIYSTGWRTLYSGMIRVWGDVTLDAVNVNSKRYEGDTYRINFSNNGPAGLSSIVLEPQSGWNYHEDPGGIYMYNYATGDGVNFIWASEIPYVIVSIAAKYENPANFAGEARYFPVPNSTYDSVNFQYGTYPYSNYYWGYGTWDTQGSTLFTFYFRKIRHWTGSSFSGYRWYWAPPLSIYNSIRAGFPTTVTVERI